MYHNEEGEGAEPSVAVSAVNMLCSLEKSTFGREVALLVWG
jgi:hypothetical protein